MPGGSLGTSNNPTDASSDPRKGYRLSGGRTNDVLDALAFLSYNTTMLREGSSLWWALDYRSLSLAIRGDNHGRHMAKGAAWRLGASR
jgi:hypothetical protein